MPNPVVYFEVLGEGDPDSFASFYSDLFGWTQNARGPEVPYRLIDTGTPEGISGGIGVHPEGKKLVTFYVQTEDLSAMLARADRLGGTAAQQILEVIPGSLFSAQVASPSGNVVGLLSGAWSPERKEAGGRHPVVHFEIAGPDAAAEQKFWGGLFEWEMQVHPEFNYAMMGPADGGIGGGIGPNPGGGAHVTFYVQADDLQDTLERAEKLGGKALTPVMDVPGGPTIAQIADPQGNMIGLVKS